MLSYTTRSRPRRANLKVLGTMAVLSLAACQSPTDAIQVADPDIINPADVQSAAGADAVRVGAIARLNSATSGGGVTTTGSATDEGIFLLGGLFADEWNNGDTFIDRQQVDQRSNVVPSFNTFLTGANRSLHRARLSGQQAIELLRKYKPTAPGWQVAEMYFVQAIAIDLLSEHLCNGLVLSTIVDGVEQYGAPITYQAALEQALSLANEGLAAVTGTTADDNRVRNALAVIKGRILVNLARFPEAATAVAGVPTNFRYQMLHSQTTRDNQIWSYNNSARRYSLSTNEGQNGLNFATAGDPRIPACLAGSTGCPVTTARRDDNTSIPLYVQLIWPARDSPVTIASGIEARLIEAEAQVTSNPAAALVILNALRLPTGTGSGGVAGLAPLVDPGTDAARVDQLFRERAFWMFSTGHRTGDLRRLIRQYGRAANTVFPTGPWHKPGNYGNDVTLPLPEAERNNPKTPQNATTNPDICMNRSP